MCLSPIRVRNKSLSIDPNGSKAYYEVPCGKCADCLAQKTEEWKMRCFNVYKWFHDRDGYTLFETLTYDDDHVPLFKGMRCFDPGHIRSFRKTLRNLLVAQNPEYSDYMKKGYFKVLITSEYGGVTHRPHYHCLFSSLLPGLDVLRLRDLINIAWPYGFIDRRETTLSRVVNKMDACGYVSKYMVKDDDFVRSLEDKIDEAKRTMSRSQFNKEYPAEDIKRIMPFHRQSQHYGDQVLENFPNDDPTITGYSHIPDAKNHWKKVRLPMYIQRQLFYDLKDDLFNLDDKGRPKKHWVLNEKGVALRSNMYSDIVKSLGDDFIDVLDKVEAIEKSRNVDNRHYVNLKSHVFELLAGRSIYEFAEYLIAYRHRFFDYNNYVIPDAESLFCKNLNIYDGRFILRRDTQDNDRLFIEFADDVNFVPDHCQVKLDPGNEKLYINFKSLPVLSEKSDIAFRDFDKIFECLCEVRSIINHGKQNAYDKRQRDKSRSKLVKEAHLLKRCSRNYNSIFT